MLFPRSTLPPYVHERHNAFYSGQSHRIFSSLQNFYHNQQPFIIHHPTFDGVVLVDLVYPFTELYGPLGIDLKAYGNDHLKVIVLGIACDLTRTFGLNYSEIPNSCGLFQFTIRVYSFIRYSIFSRFRTKRICATACDGS